MKKHYSEEKASKAHHDSEGREGEEDTEQKTNNNKEEETENHLHSSITSHSPPRSKSPSPPHYHSDSSGSSISDDHHSVSPANPPILDQQLPPPLLPLVTAHRFQVEPEVVTKVDPGAEEGFIGVKDVEQATIVSNRPLRPELSKSRKMGTLSKLLLGLRITAFVFCLVSIAVLAADKEEGWARDSFYLYKEFRYSLSVNVIGFAYSGLQMVDLAKYLITRKHIVEHTLMGYFTFALDQILTYLIMSASSSAATRAYDWESNWGKDKFPYMANASVALSFTAFVAFALASLVSGSIVCRFR